MLQDQGVSYRIAQTSFTSLHVIYFVPIRPNIVCFIACVAGVSGGERGRGRGGGRGEGGRGEGEGESEEGGRERERLHERPMFLDFRPY